MVGYWLKKHSEGILAMLTQATFRNYKALRSVDVTFERRLTVIVGPNGSGKSSILEGIDYLCKPVVVNQPASFDTLEVLRKRDATSSQIELAYSASEMDGGRFRLAIIPAGHPFLNGKSVNMDGPSGLFVRLYQKEPIDDQNFALGYFVQQQFQTSLLRSVLIRFDSSRLFEPSLTNTLQPRLESNGTGLSSTLAYMMKKYPDDFASVIAHLRNIISNIERVRLDLVSGPGGICDELLFDFKSASNVSARFVSAGTLNALGLLTALHMQPYPDVVLYDDLDNDLHPRAQAELVRVLRSILDQFPNLQIIATSHSPYILDRLEPEEVRITAIGDDGGVICAPLKSHPDFDRWKETMTPGEFWSHVGEDWLRFRDKATGEVVAP